MQVPDSQPASPKPVLIPPPNKRVHPIIVNGQLDLIALAAAQLSPDSALNILHTCQWTTEGTIAIATALVNTIHSRMAEADKREGELKARIAHLESVIEGYQGTFNTAPDGYSIAINSTTAIQIPIGSGFY